MGGGLVLPGRPLKPGPSICSTLRRMRQPG